MSKTGGKGPSQSWVLTLRFRSIRGSVQEDFPGDLIAIFAKAVQFLLKNGRILATKSQKHKRENK
jgi:hypothetical protein